MYGYGYPNYFAPGQPMPGQLEQLRIGQQPAQMQPMQPPAQPAAPQQSGLIWVQGEAGAKSYMTSATTWRKRTRSATSSAPSRQGKPHYIEKRGFHHGIRI